MREMEGKTSGSRNRDRFFGLKVNYLVGHLLFRARLCAEVSAECAARELDMTEQEFREIERGSVSIAVCDLAKLAELYGIADFGTEYFMVEIPEEAERRWTAHEFAAIAVHRFCIDHNVPLPSSAQHFVHA